MNKKSAMGKTKFFEPVLNYKQCICELPDTKQLCSVLKNIVTDWFERSEKISVISGHT